MSYRKILPSAIAWSVGLKESEQRNVWARGGETSVRRDGDERAPSGRSARRLTVGLCDCARKLVNGAVVRVRESHPEKSSSLIEELLRSRTRQLGR